MGSGLVGQAPGHAVDAGREVEGRDVGSSDGDPVPTRAAGCLGQDGVGAGRLALAQELAAFGIRVHIVEPGVTRTAILPSGPL